MNFYKKTPFILFVLLYLACLLTQMQELPSLQPNTPSHVTQSQSMDLEDVDDQIQMVDFKEDGSRINEKQRYPQARRASLQKQSQIHTVTSSTLQYQQQTATHTKRLLQQEVTTNNGFLTICRLLFQPLLSISRIITNSIQLFLPYIILCESFILIAFWNCQKHYLNNLYTKVFTSYWDLFNAVRLISQPTVSTNSMLGQYGFSSTLVFNLSGEVLVALVLLVFTVISKFFSICLKHERLRIIAANLRPIWNSYFFAILPRVATFVGLHWKLGQLQSFNVIDTIVCCLLSMVLVFYFIMLLIQIRRTRQKKQLLQQRKNQVGLLKRIDHKRQFRFDCLRYSSMYYPAMRYIILLFYYLPIGLSWDFYYISFGGPIIAQLTIMMFEVSSTPYILLRDKILPPIHNFLFVIVHLCIITVGLAQSVSHSQVSQIAETVLFAILIFVFGSALVGTALDVANEIRIRCNEVKQQQKKDESSIHNFTRQISKSKTIENSVKKSNQSEQQSEQNEQDNHKTSAPLKKDTQTFSSKLKIHKVRKGKVI